MSGKEYYWWMCGYSSGLFFKSIDEAVADVEKFCYRAERGYEICVKGTHEIVASASPTK